MVVSLRRVWWRCRKPVSTTAAPGAQWQWPFARRRPPALSRGRLVQRWFGAFFRRSPLSSPSMAGGVALTGPRQVYGCGQFGTGTPRSKNAIGGQGCLLEEEDDLGQGG